MSLSTEQKAILKYDIDNNPDVAALGSDYPAIASYYNFRDTTSTPNPEEQEMVPQPLTMDEIFSTLEGADPGSVSVLTKGSSWGPVLGDIRTAVEGNDRDSMNSWLSIISADLSSEGKGVLQSLLSREILDPSWQENIVTSQPSRADELGLPGITARDVQHAMNG